MKMSRLIHKNLLANFCRVSVIQKPSLYKEPRSQFLTQPWCRTHLRHIQHDSDESTHRCGEEQKTNSDTADCPEKASSNPKKIYIANRFIVKDDIIIPNGNLTDGKFLPLKQCLLAMSKQDLPIFKHIPLGVKEDTCFLLDSKRNHLKRQQKKNALFRDDCGSWFNSSARNYYIKYYFILKYDDLYQIRCIKGDYIHQKDYKPGKKSILIEPQPSPEDVLMVLYYLSVHALSTSYRRTITEVRHLPVGFESVLDRKVLDVSFVQYSGKFPGYAPHGRSISNESPYIRLPSHIVQAIDEYVEQGEYNQTIVFQKLLDREFLLNTKQNFHAVKMYIRNNFTLEKKET